MTEAVVTCLICESFLEFLKERAWCKQGDDTLVCVQPCTAEIVVAFGDHEVKVYPGGTAVRLNKSWLTQLQQKTAEGTPIPILLVWRSQGLEMWYRRTNSLGFPYDTWSDPVADAYERERVFLPAEHGGAKFSQYYAEVLGRANACPPQIPKL